MARISAFRGTWEPNRRPYVVVAPDAYVSIQGETTVIACGECRRKINVNRYVTSISTEGSVDSPPGSASFAMSVPDTDVNEFYVDGQLVIIPMMEIEIFAKGYYTVGGFPQYYRIFWGVVSSVSKSWSNGSTTINVSCRDILRWWELTNVNLNPAFLEGNKSKSGFQLFQNAFAGDNPYTVIIDLAKEAMGDFSLTTGSFTSFRPEQGAESPVLASYARDIMAYWQLKFGNIWNALVLYGTSGQAYSFTGLPGNVSSKTLARQIFQQEAANLNLNPETAAFKIQPHEVAAFKIDISKAGDVNFFQSEQQSKLSIALTARDQAGAYEFYCDTTGDIIFKPPFFNMNVIPNKPVSWINDFEIMDENIQDTEQEVYTHVTGSGNAFGGKVDWGLNDEFTTPRTGVIDWHLLKRYGWRRIDVQLEWAGNPRKLFYHLLDHMDKVNSKRHNGSITIPMRPEIRQGFPVWIPKYDCFYYINGISHNFAPGGTATTVLTLSAKRQKFIAPKNVGRITKTGAKEVQYKDPKNPKKKITRRNPTFKIEFPSQPGETSGLSSKTKVTQKEEFGGPAILRDAKTGKLLGFPNAVMVYRSALNGVQLAKILEDRGSRKAQKPKQQDKKAPGGKSYSFNETVGAVLAGLQSDSRAAIIDRIRAHRYEAGMNNIGAYDYAHDVNGIFKEFSIVPSDSVEWGAGTEDPEKGTSSAGQAIANLSKEAVKGGEDRLKALIQRLETEEADLKAAYDEKNKAALAAQKDFNQYLKDTYGRTNVPKKKYTQADEAQLQVRNDAKDAASIAKKDYDEKRAELREARANRGAIRRLPAINTMVRPVSDEFGFEVIGHYRYGRGTFIDRGQVQIQVQDPAVVGKNSRVVNQLNIQFAAHGGLLTDNPRQSNLGLDSPAFAEAFEKLVPDDYVTGASFKGANYGEDATFQEVNPTGQATYTDAINNTVQGRGGGRGTAVFAEADALRRSVTLAELKPTLDGFSVGSQSVEFEKCACTLNKADWLSVLPQSFLDEVLFPFGARGLLGAQENIPVGAFPQALISAGLDPSDVTADGIQNLLEQEAVTGDTTLRDSLVAAGVDPTDPASIQNAVDNSGDPQTVTASQGSPPGPNETLSAKTGFFDALHAYLQQRFKTDYEGENLHREQYAINGGREVVTPDDAGVITDNLLDDVGGSLYDRAALGDPDALAALKNDVNFDFSASGKALEDFKDDVDAITDKAEKDFAEVGKSFDQVGEDLSGNPTGVTVRTSDASSSGRFPPPPPPGPVLGDPANASPGPILGNFTDDEEELNFDPFAGEDEEQNPDAFDPFAGTEQGRPVPEADD